MLNAVLHTTEDQVKMTSQTWHAGVLGRGYDAVIFDCDGTLVDSTDAHFASFVAAAADQGFVFDRDWYLARTGLDRVSLFEQFANEHADEFDIAKAINQSIATFVQTAHRVTAIAPTQRLVEQLGTNHALAVGTNAEPVVARASLHATGLFEHFDHIVAKTEGLAPKPAPDIFDAARRLLGTESAKTLVVEDSIQGVTAAKHAGMDVIEILAR